MRAILTVMRSRTTNSLPLLIGLTLAAIAGCPTGSESDLPEAAQSVLEALDEASSGAGVEVTDVTSAEAAESEQTAPDSAAGASETPPASDAPATPGLATGLAATPPEIYAEVPEYSPPLGFGAFGLPDRVDLTTTGFFPPPGNQGRQSSCSAFASTYAVKTYQESRERGTPPRDSTQIYSPAFIYYYSNEARGNAQLCTDAGVRTMYNALKELRDRGAPSWAEMPYDDTTCARPPSPAVEASAKQARIRDFRKLETGDDARRALVDGQPVIIGLAVGARFQAALGPTFTLDDYLNDLATGASGHAFVIVGYDDVARTFKVMNSWGPTWGQGGFWQISYDVVAQAAALRKQGRTLFELWVALDEIASPIDPKPADEQPGENTTPAPAAAAKLTLAAVRWQQTSAEVAATFDLSVDESLRGREIAVLLGAIDAESQDVIKDAAGVPILAGDILETGQTTQFRGLRFALRAPELLTASGGRPVQVVLVATNADGSVYTGAAGPLLNAPSEPVAPPSQPQPAPTPTNPAPTDPGTITSPRVYAGVATVVVNFYDPFGRLLGHQAYQHAVQAVVAPPLQTQTSRETNPFNLMIVPVGPPTQDGQFSIHSALPASVQGRNDLLLQYWQLQGNLSGFQGALLNPHNSEAASTNLINTPSEIAPGLWLPGWPFPMAAGTQLQGAMNGGELQIVVQGAVIQGTRAFAAEIRAQRVQ